MVDQFGNYLCQKIIEVCNDNELKQLVNVIIPSIVKIIMNIHGTRSIQTLIDILSKNLDFFNEEISRIILQITPAIKDLSLNVHGNHVIQAFLCIFKSSSMPSDPDQEGTEAYDQYT